MKTSARNQLFGTVRSVRHDGLFSEVVLALPGGHEISAVITRQSCESLALAVGKEAVALIKASGIVIATDLAHIRLSARNQLSGIIGDVERGAVNSVVTLDLDGGIRLIAGITLQSTEQLELHPGQKATAVFKAGSVILGVPA